MWIKCLAEGHKKPGIDGNRTRNPFDPDSRVQSNIPWHLPCKVPVVESDILMPVVTSQSRIMPWSHLCVKPPRMSHV